MANQYINVYMHNPTAGDKDGTCVSTDGTLIAPISAVLASNSIGQSKKKKLAIRTEKGYRTVGETEIYINLVTDELTTTRDFENFNLCWEPEYNKDEKLIEGNVDVSRGKITTSNSIGAKNKIFWLEMNTNSNEKSQIDRSARLVIKAMIGKV